MDDKIVIELNRMDIVWIAVLYIVVAPLLQRIVKKLYRVLKKIMRRGAS